MKCYSPVILAVLGCFIFCGCSTLSQDRLKLKQEIKEEILAELREERQNQELKFASEEREQLIAEIERKLLAKLQTEVRTIIDETPKMKQQIDYNQYLTTGSAEGRILFRERGLKGCRVKLVKMVKSGNLNELFNLFKEGFEFETVTDEQGKYRFDKLPIGVYKLKWELPHDKGWIRRLRNKPDVIIEEGMRKVLEPVETYRRLVPR